MPQRKLFKLFLVQLFSLVVFSQAISAQPYVIETLVSLGTAVSGPAISAELGVVPENMPDGDVHVVALIGGQFSQSNAFIAIKR